MKKSRNLLAIIFILFGICAIEVGCVNEAKASQITDFTYQPGDGDITITGYHGSDTALDIPDYINGWPVVAIADRAFYNNDSITDVVVHGGWDYRIGEYAFYDCSRLTSLKLYSGGGGFNICSSAFGNCDALTSAILPVPDMLYIGVNAFRDSDSLTSIILSKYRDTETYIYDYAFADCDSLADIVFPDQSNGIVRIIGRGVFSKCPILKDISITDHVLFDIR